MERSIRKHHEAMGYPVDADTMQKLTDLGCYVNYPHKEQFLDSPQFIEFSRMLLTKRTISSFR